MIKKIVSGSVFLLFFLFFFNVHAEGFRVDESAFVYKTVEGAKLEMIMYKPETLVKNLPAIIFFYGANWENGDLSQFQYQARYLASRGMVAFCADYRTGSKYGTSPVECVKDARSALRYLKIHGAELNIDTARIVASGVSAGGHLALCTALIDNVNESSDDLSVSPKPFAFVLFNPVVDTGKKGYNKGIPAGMEFEISPVHHISANVPPVLILHGKEDKTAPVENVIRFNYLMKQQNNKSILEIYKKQDEKIISFSENQKFFQKTLQQTEEFLQSYDLLSGQSWIKEFCRN